MRMTMKGAMLVAVAMLVALMVFASTALAQDDGSQDDPQCIDGILDRDGDGQISSIEAAQAGADATQGGACSGADDVQYGDDEESTAGVGETTGFTGECAGAIEQLAADQPNVSEEIFQSYYSYLPDVGGCVSFEGGTYIDNLSVPVFEPDTGEELGILKDLDPDLTSGEFSVTYEEFCGAFEAYLDGNEYAQDYYDQQANSQEQAILDPDGDGQACTDEDDAFLSGDGGGQSSGAPCSDFLGYSEGYWGYFPDSGGCVLLEGIGGLLVAVLNAPVLDPETEEELGTVKDLDPDLTGGDFSVSYEEFCGAFPTPEAEGFSYASLTAQDYFEQEANDKEQAILDPNSDGLACTSEDEAFLSGDMDFEPRFELEDTWTGTITQTNPGGDVLEFEIEAEMISLFDITDAMVGEVVGEVGYPSVGCYGVWILDGFDGDALVVEERIMEGKENCFETPVTLTPRDDGSLEYYFRNEDGIVGEGILTLRGSSAPNVGTDGLPPVSGYGEETPPPAYEPINFTRYVASNPRGFVYRCGAVASETFEGVRRGELPETGGGWTVLLFSGATLFGGGWFLIRRFSR